VRNKSIAHQSMKESSNQLRGVRRGLAKQKQNVQTEVLAEFVERGKGSLARGLGAAQPQARTFV
jgi:hypothetical protein